MTNHNHKLLAGGMVLTAFILLAVSLWRLPQTEQAQAQQGARITTAAPLNLNRIFKVNVPSFFKELVTMTALEVEGESIFGSEVTFENEVVFDGQMTLRNDLFANGVNIDVGSGEITASNILYSLEAGSGISISDGQNPTISATDLGSSQNIFKKIKVGSDTIEADSNTDQFELAAGTGIGLSRDGDKVTFTNASLPGFIKSGTYALLADGVSRIGVGTSTPGNVFEVNSGVADTSGFSFTQLTSSSTAGVGGGKVLSLDSGGRIILVADQTGGTPSAESVLPSATNGMTIYYNGTNWVASDNLFHDGGSVGISNAAPTSRLHVNTNLASKIGLIVQSYASQTANLQEWRNSLGSTLSYIDPNGVFNGQANVTGTINPGLTTGSVLFQGPSGIAQDNSNFFWDDTNKRLGIGSGSTVLEPLSVFGANQVLTTGRGQIGAYSTDAQGTDLGGQLVLGGQDGNGRRSFAAVAGRKENSTSGDRSGYLQFSTRATGPGTTDLTERMRITSGGYVGIGTTNPSNKLHIKGEDGLLRLESSVSGGDFTMITNGYGLYFFDNDNAVTRLKIERNSGNFAVGVNESTDIASKLVINGNAVIGSGYTTTAAPTNGLLVEGNVGIGTTTPGAKLDVAGDLFAPTATFSANYAGGTALKVVGGPSANTTQIVKVQNNSGTTLMAVDGYGRTSVKASGTSNTDFMVGGETGFDNLSDTLVYFLSRSATQKGLVVRGAASQTANLTEWQNSSGTVLSRVANDGRLVGGGYTLGQTANNTVALDFLGYYIGEGAIRIRNYNGEVSGPQYPVILGRHSGSATLLSTQGPSLSPLFVKGAASQTANLTEWQNSSGTVLASVKKDGLISQDITYTDVGTTGVGFSQSLNYSPGATAINDYPAGISTNFLISGSGGGTGAITGIAASVSNLQTAGNLSGINGLSTTASQAGAGTVTELRGLQIQYGISGSGNVANGVGINVLSPTKNTGNFTTTTGVWVKNQGLAGVASTVGLQINDQTGSTANYAIFTGAGLNRLGDQLSVIGSADRVQTIIRANATQTANLTEWQNSAGTVLSVVDENGYLGIGTLSPEYKLDIINGEIRLSDNFDLKWGDGSAAIDGSGSSDFIRFYTFSQEKMRIDSNGNVGIGVTAPLTNLHVSSTETLPAEKGMLMLSRRSDVTHRLIAGYEGNSAQGDFGYIQALQTLVAAKPLLLNPNGGNVGIGTGSSIMPAAQLEIKIQSAATKGQILKAAASQTANLTEWQNSAGTVLGAVSSTGGLSLSDQLNMQNNDISNVGDIVSPAVAGAQDAASLEFFLRGGNDSTYEALSMKSYMADASTYLPRFTITSREDMAKVAFLNSNVGIGLSSFGTNAAKVLGIAGSTAPTTSITDGIQLFAVDVSGSHELQVMDEAGNTTTLSPHNFSLIGSQSEELAWSFYSQRNSLAINADMTKALRVVEKLSGEKLIYLKDLATGQMLEDESDASKITELADNGSIGEVAKWNYQLWTFIGEVIFEKPVQFLADVTLRGRIFFSPDQVGVAVIPAGATTVKVSFTQTLPIVPVVQLTPQQPLSAGIALKEVTTAYFMIELPQALDKEVSVNWFAALKNTDNLAQPKVEVISPASSHAVMVSPVPTSVAATPTPTSEPVSTPSPDPSPELVASPSPTAVPSPTVEPSSTPVISPEPVATESAVTP